MKQFIAQNKLRMLFLFAFLIRLIHVNQSLWLDEATTAMTVKTFSLSQIITQFSPSDFHPPLYYLVMKVWTSIFGYSEVALRMPSVLFSLAAGWMVYSIITNGTLRISKEEIREKRYEKIAFWAAAFFLCNPLIIYYSQEARMYAMVTFTIAVSFYYLIKVQTANFRLQSMDFWLMNLFLILSFYTFYASIFYIASVYLYLFWKDKNKGRTLISAAVFTIGMVFIAPLIVQQFENSREALISVSNWSLVLGKVTLKNLLLFPIKFTSGRISFFPKSIYYLLAGGWMAVVGGLLCFSFWQAKVSTESNDSGPARVTKIAVFFLITPLILGIIFSLNTPLLQYFRFQYLIIFMSIMLGIAVCHSERSEESRKYRDLSIAGRPASHLYRMTGYILLFGFVAWSLSYLIFPQFHREDWKSLANALQKETTEVYMIPSSGDPIRYYAPTIEIRDIRMSNIRASASDNLVVIPYTTDIYGVDYVAELQSQEYQIHSTFYVRGLSYERWKSY